MAAKSTKKPDASAQVRSYLAAQPALTARELRKLRATIKAAAPKAVETFGYGMPGFRLDDKLLIWYAGWKQHTSLYPISATIKRTFADELEGYKMSTGTLQFPLSDPLPLALVNRILKARVAEVRAGAKKAR